LSPPEGFDKLLLHTCSCLEEKSGSVFTLFTFHFSFSFILHNLSLNKNLHFMHPKIIDPFFKHPPLLSIKIFLKKYRFIRFYNYHSLSKNKILGFFCFFSENLSAFFAFFE